MKNWKKAGLTALAGTLVATSAFAGAMTVSGTANLTYAANTGAQDNAGNNATDIELGQDGNRWGINKTLSFSGSGEMDNGWTVTVSQSLAAATTTGVGLTIDMGDIGSLNYEADTGARGIGKIADMIPTADEDVGNGIDIDGSGTAGSISGRVGGGTKGFHYSKAMDMVEIGIGYAVKGQGGNAQGGVSGAGGGKSSIGGFIKIDPMDGLEIGFGSGETASATVGQTDDHSSVYASYVYGPITAAVQQSTVDTYGSTVEDDESTAWGVLYAVNDELSLSYGSHENDGSTTTVDEEITGWSAAYTVGSMTFKAHRNKGTNVSNTVSNTSEHTEIGVSFAF